MINKINRLRSPRYASYTALKRLLGSLFPGQRHQHTNFPRRYFDTFDWRLFKGGYLLEEDRGLLRLSSLSTPVSIYEEPVTSIPRFYWDLPTGHLKDIVKNLVNERALILLGTVDVKQSLHEIQDASGKVVLRLVVESLYDSAKKNRRGAIAAYLQVHPLRGYEPRAKELLERLTSVFEFTECQQETAKILFPALGRNPGDYSSKIDLEIFREMPSHTALSSALIFNLDIMEKNERGILKDIDMEFLHDFRIAGRRSRSLMTQLHGVFPETPLKNYKSSFSWLSKATSLHRDLDVFLWDFNNYVKMISNNSGEELEPLRSYLIQNRETEHKKLLKTLNTKRFDRFKSNWRDFLEEEKAHTPDSQVGNSPILEVANRNIWRNYRKIQRQGKAIEYRYSFESIHTLRKNAKKLRYLVDTFKTLYPDNDIETAIRNLRRLQNNLGKITDMHVQQAVLHNWKSALISRKNIPQETITAIGELKNICAVKEKKARKKFNQRYHEFNSKQNQHLYQDMFISTAR